MSLRTKIFILFAILLGLLASAQWYITRSVTQDISKEMGQVAFSVARDISRHFVTDQYRMSQQIVVQAIQQTQSMLRGSGADSEAISTGKFEVRLAPPQVEVRLDNQMTGDEVVLITDQGIRTVPIPRQGAIEAVERLEERLMIGTLTTLLIALLLAAYLAHRITAPMRMLSTASERLAHGELGSKIEPSGSLVSREFKMTIDSFNHMSEKLVEMDELHEKVRENEHYKELGELARGLAHSIRNPLNTLGLTVEQMAEEQESERKEQLRQTAERQIERVDLWIKTFMTLSLSEDMETSEINLFELVQDIQLEVSYQSSGKIKFEIQGDRNLTIDGVEAELKTILHSVIINAVQASPAESVIQIELTKDGSQLKICVKDEGGGLDKGIEEHLFKPHQSTKSKGTGLGLFMAHRLATTRYAGSISLKNRKEKGVKAEIALSSSRSRT